MPRPVKCRRVAHIPGTIYFKPAGIPLRELDEVVVSVDEIEAVRLKDIEGLEQEQGAEKMNISRPTFQRMLTAARGKIADALINGKAIRIDGGNIEITQYRLCCRHDGTEWEVTPEELASGRPQCCPECNTPQELPAGGMGWHGKGRGHCCREQRRR